MLNEDNCSKPYLMLSFIIGLIFNVGTVEAKTNYNALHYNHDIIAKYENGGMGYKTISKDNYGGYSYGKWQISTERRNGKKSTFDFFMLFVEKSDYSLFKKLENAGGQPAAFKGDKKFIDTWNKLAQNKKFQKLYDEFLLKEQIIPVYKRMDNSKNIKLDIITTWASSNNAIQAAIKSTIVQHGSGGAYGMIRNIVDIYNPKTKGEFLKRLYEYRAVRFPKYERRYKAEYAELNEYLNTKAAKLA